VEGVERERGGQSKEGVDGGNGGLRWHRRRPAGCGGGSVCGSFQEAKSGFIDVFCAE